MSDPGDLHVHVRFDDLQLSIIHEGRAGDLALQQAVLMQIPRAWLELLSETFGAKGAKVDEP
jgi:hypothetical protein